jgi:hypothetical protein
MNKAQAIIYLTEKVKDNEEVFVLKAHDVLAVPTVFYWAQLAEKHGVDLKKIRGAWECAARMLEYTGRRIPD